MRYILSTALFQLCCFFATAQSSEDLYKEGMRRYGNKDYVQAKNYFSKAITANKDSAKYYLQRGRANYELKKFQEAFDDYALTLKVDPNNVFAYLYRADLLLNSNQPYESIKEANMAIMLTNVDSIKVTGYINNGVARCNVRDFDGAYKDLMKALSYDSLNPAVYNNLAMIFDEQGDSAKAIAYNVKAYQLDTNFLPALSNIGFIRAKYGNYKGAIAYFDKALKRQPDMAYVYNNRGYAKMMIQDYDGAREDIDHSIKLLPDNSYAYRNRALLNIALKKNKKVCADLLKAKELGFDAMYGDEVEKLLKQYCH